MEEGETRREAEAQEKETERKVYILNFPFPALGLYCISITEFESVKNDLLAKPKNKDHVSCLHFANRLYSKEEEAWKFSKSQRNMKDI